MISDDSGFQANKLRVFQILKKWEILRIPYNFIIILIIVIGTLPIWSRIPNYKIYLIENIISFFLANILYFVGPLVEIGFVYFRIDLSRHRIYLWIFGVFFSILVILYSVLMVYKKYS